MQSIVVYDKNTAIMEMETIENIVGTAIPIVAD